MRNIMPILLILLILMGGMIGLQFFLSTRKNRWLGVILPCICLVCSLLTIGGFMGFEVNTSTRVTSYAGDGTVIEEIIQENKHSKNVGSVIGSSVVLFLIMNIPTGIGLLIYFGCREKLKKTQQLEHMQIQDLE